MGRWGMLVVLALWWELIAGFSPPVGGFVGTGVVCLVSLGTATTSGAGVRWGRTIGCLFCAEYFWAAMAEGCGGGRGWELRFSLLVPWYGFVCRRFSKRSRSRVRSSRGRFEFFCTCVAPSGLGASMLLSSVCCCVNGNLLAWP